MQNAQEPNLYHTQLQAYQIFSLFQMDNENYSIGNLTINSMPGKFFKASNLEFSNYIIWNSETNYFMLSSSLDMEIMKQIAESVNLSVVKWLSLVFIYLKT